MDINVLTTATTTFVNALAGGLHTVQSTASGVLRSLAVIEIVLFGFWMALDGGERLSAAFQFLLQLSFWIWFAGSFPSLVKLFVDTLIQYGLSAGGQGGNVALILDPSRIAGMALDVTKPIADAIKDAGLTHIADALIMTICHLTIIACFFVIAAQMALAVIEYYLIVALATCLIPFGISRHTKFIAEKAIGAVIAVSVKLMVLSFVIGLIQPVLGQLHFVGTGEISLNEILSMIVVCVLLAVIVWRAPGLASDLLAASPSLSTAAVGQNITGAVSSGVRSSSSAITHGVGATKAAASMVLAGATGGLSAVRNIGSAMKSGWTGKDATAAAAGGAKASGHRGSGGSVSPEPPTST